MIENSWKKPTLRSSSQKKTAQRLCKSAFAAFLLFLFLVALISLQYPLLGWNLFIYGLLLVALVSLIALLTLREKRPPPAQKVHDDLPDSDASATKEEPKAGDEEVLNQENDSDKKGEREDKILPLAHSHDHDATYNEETDDQKAAETAEERLESRHQEELFEYERKVDQLNNQLLETQEKLQQAIQKNSQQKLLLQEYHHQLQTQENRIANLEGNLQEKEQQLNDQCYEIKTLLELNELGEIKEPPADLLEQKPYSTLPMTTEQIHTLQLMQSLEKASHISGPAFYREHHAPLGHTFQTSHALDLKRLYEMLCAQNDAALFLYNPNEERILLTTPAVEKVTGWTTETFTQSFFTLLGDKNSHLFKQNICSLPDGELKELSVSMDLYSGKRQTFSLLIGRVPSGLFQRFFLALLFKTP